MPTGLLLVDSRVEYRAPFLARASEKLHVRVLTPGENALQVLLEETVCRSPLAIHLVGHGRPGQLQLGCDAWNSGFIARESDRLAQLGAALGPDAGLLIYGCEVGHGSQGEAFVTALEAATGVSVAAASGPVGAAALGASWTLDSGHHAVAALSVPEWPGHLGLVSQSDPPYRGWIGNSEVMQFYAAAAIRADGSVVAWGKSDWGGSTAAVASALDGTIDVVEIVGNLWSYAALRADGSVVSWGRYMDNWFTTPADSSPAWGLLDGTIDVTKLYSHPLGFAALRADGSVVQWSSSYGSLLLDGSSDSQKAVKVLSGAGTFFGLRADGVAGGFDNVVSLTASQQAFAVLHGDGSVTTSGYAYYGGDSSAVASQLDGTIDVKSITATQNAFAALRADGSVVTWGSSDAGGNSSSVASLINGVGVKVVSLYAAGSSFAALRSDGSLVTWGGSPATNGAPIAALDGTIKVVSVTPGPTAFAALRADGSVVMSDNTDYPDNFRREALNGTIDVVQVVANNNAFAALRADGSVIAWGNSDLGGSNNAFADRDGTIDVVALAATDRAFQALRADGSVIAWGDAGLGGSTSAASASLTNVVALASPWTRDQVSYGTDESLAGGAGDDTLWGFDGNDTLTGGAGADLMLGGAGNDTYVVAQAGDKVRENPSPYLSTDAGGTDLVQASVTYTLGAFVESLTLTGSAATNGTGNALANTLTGNTGANVLSGLAGLDTLAGGNGNDRLFGGAGNDSLSGGGGVDRFVFDTATGSSNVDRLTDFVRGTDKLVLDDDIFTKLGTGTTAGKAIAAGNYKIGTKAGDADDYLLYDPATDKLFYDKDGSGTGAAVQIATIVLTGTAAPAASDFLLVT